MSDSPTLVKESWLQKVQNAVFSGNGTLKDSGASSLFYDVRPAVLASAWIQNAAGVWNATAKFIVNDVVDSSFTFPVVAPTATANPGGTVNSTRFFVVWRGRWEMIAGAGGSSGSSAGTLMTQTLVTGLVASVSSDGWLTLSTTGTTIYYYGETSAQ